MTSRTDTARSLPDRQAIGEQLRELRNAVGFNQRQVADMVGFSQCSVSYIERAYRDVLLSTAVDLAAVYGRHLVVAADYHLPLLDLTADEIVALVQAAGWWADAAAAEAIRDDQPDDTDPNLIAALDKLTTTEETT